ncbi:MAG: MinD/ParA family protein [Pseudobutyrivibrio ruminis]|uniref:MinD/ParA family protein n=1 Tax=Pseudobutyrivibrio ruminis TaxID=46206 RepID=A0A927U8V3_9FIRM|nr:MinD/ParA family protein [Pseudobutyrivibrio sp.]MBE5919266.1 MinD/ParA family protein [Pseudobutyrivibrio ruminis]MBQ6464224.1 MinD/ParA family protein [Pseudobutyrivibrio sp.]
MDQAQNLRNVIKASNIRTVEKTKVITITSGKGGVGKSNMAVNLAVWFTRLDKKVIILDGDFGLANVEVMFGTLPKYNLSDVIFKGMSIRDIITTGPMGIGFISGGSGVVGLNNLNREQIAFLVHNLSLLNDLCDILIIDTGAGVSDQVLEFVLASPEVILVSTPEPSSLTDSYSLMKAMYKSPKYSKDGTNVHLVANKVTSEAEGRAVYEKMNSVVQKFLGGSLDYLGYVAYDSQLEKAVRNQKVVSLEYPTSKATKCFESVASKLLKKDENTHFRWGVSHIFNALLKDRA